MEGVTSRSSFLCTRQGNSGLSKLTIRQCQSWPRTQVVWDQYVATRLLLPMKGRATSKMDPTKPRKLERQFAHLNWNTYFVHCFHLNAYSLLVSNDLHSYYSDSSELDIAHLPSAFAVKVILQLRVRCKEGLTECSSLSFLLCRKVYHNWRRKSVISDTSCLWWGSNFPDSALLK